MNHLAGGAASPSRSLRLGAPAANEYREAELASREELSNERRIWRGALACVVLAASTGVLMRFGMIHGLPFGLELGNVRHAHSHLMFFSWVTPLLIAFSAALRPARYRRSAYLLATLTLVTGLIAYLPYLLSGYGTLQVAGRELPLSMMTSGLAGVAWYLFIGFHFWTARAQPRTAALLALDGAVALLVLASLSVSAVPLLSISGAGGAAWTNALIALFLESFGEGWFGLGLLALGYQALTARDNTETSGARIGIVLLTVGLIAGSLARLAIDVGEGWAQWPALAATAVASAGMLLALRPLLQHLPGRQALWGVPLVFLLLKALTDPILSWPGVQPWSNGAFRVLLLHAFLLGAVSLGLTAVARYRLGARDTRAATVLVIAVLVMLAALIPLAIPLPVGWSGVWVLQAAAWTSLAPLAVFVSMLAIALRRR